MPMSLHKLSRSSLEMLFSTTLTCLPSINSITILASAMSTIKIVGVGTPAFWLFMVGVVPLSLVFTWVYNNTRRSTLAVILFHAMVNFTGELIALDERADAFSILIWFVAAVAITALWGAGTLAHKPEALPSQMLGDEKAS